MKRLLAVLGCCVFATGLYAQKKPEPFIVTTQDNWNIYGVYQPSAEPGGKVALLLHDIGKNYTGFNKFMEQLTTRGIGYAAFDLRGHGRSTNVGTYSTFAKEGVDNDYNQMTRDINAVIEYIKGKKVAEENIVLIGVGMGANVAAKAISLWPSVGGLALLTPVTNFRDVLPIPALRVYKGPVFIAAAADDKKTFLEASVMRNVSFLSSGEGMVTFATAYDKKGHELLDTWVMPELLQWLQTPQRPELRPDVVEEEQEMYDGVVYEPIANSATEEALFPSVLQ